VNCTTFDQPAPGGLQRLLDLPEDGRALLLEAVARGEHAGDIERFRALHPRDVRVGADRLAERIDVVDLDIGHVYLGGFGLPRPASCAFTIETSSARRTGFT
jgi:hypothetical protein